ncbi:MAG TPA: 4-oxalocrotonate tautomerase family protein [Candidatus Omnitrophota bacterium]|jgi:4-oxalocrotonate tautomerase|nr:4-oxalocrotonate tautomerase family protein [Candidatus Omnitrophota bacterium]
MPYVNLKLVGKISRAQKEQIVKEFTATLERVANKPKDHTYVVIDEIAGENWGVGDHLLG